MSRFARAPEFVSPPHLAFTSLEFQSAFLGLVRQNRLSRIHAEQRIALFQADLPLFEIVALTPSVLSSCEFLLNRFAVVEGLRPADAIQLASALDIHGRAPLDTFLTTDVILKTCAAASKLTVKP